MKTWARANKGFIMFLLLFGVIRTAVADWSPIPSASMRPTLLEGDVVFINRLAFNVKVPLTDVVLAHTGEPKRGEIVIFASPQDGTRLIKRLMAVPGDVVEMRNERLIVNGQSATYAPAGTATETVGPTPNVLASKYTETLDGHTHNIQIFPDRAFMRSFGPMTIPNGQYLMLGDSRDNSNDSRFIGLVPRKLLTGRAERVLVSADILGNWLPRSDRFAMKLQ
jgi:signal peptidase I